MTTYSVRVLNYGFDPPTLCVYPGDAVRWESSDASDHTATAIGGAFDEYIGAWGTSNDVTFTEDQIGTAFEYYCMLHPGMDHGVIRVTAKAEKRHTTHATPTAIGVDRFVPDDWRAMSRVIAANWAFDLGSDIKHALSVETGPKRRLIAQRWGKVKQWWIDEVGVADADISPTDLLKHDHEPLEALAHRIRATWVGLVRARVKITKHPNPDRENAKLDPEWAQSQDPFGKAITVLPRPRFAPDGSEYSCDNPGPWSAEGIAFLCRVNPYAVATYYGLIEKLEQGDRITREDRENYAAKKAAVSPGDYQLLAAHQSNGLIGYWGTPGFDEAKFTGDMWRMTFQGQWQSQERALWHWLRFIDLYLGVKDKDPNDPGTVLPDLLTVSIERGGGLLPNWAIAIGACGLMD